MSPPVLLIGGGARSGKSDLALRLADTLGQSPVFVATGQAWDDEMRRRIQRHRADRPAHFRTVEAPLGVPEIVSAPGPGDVLVVDCLTLWLTNELLSQGEDVAAGEAHAEARVDALVVALEHAPLPTILVTNEVGLGIVPMGALSRAFRDVAGRCHRKLAARADRVYLGAMGMLLRLKPGPVEPVPDVLDGLP
jgi:adenosylcobinamide kinase / adenosylcobinamide-phosphate guanylyltransferase